MGSGVLGMDHVEFRAIRKKLGLSCQKMANALGFSSINGGRSVRTIEAGGSVTGSVKALLRYMKQGVDNMSKYPEYMQTESHVFKMHYPRCILDVRNGDIDWVDDVHYVDKDKIDAEKERIVGEMKRIADGAS